MAFYVYISSLIFFIIDSKLAPIIPITPPSAKNKIIFSATTPIIIPSPTPAAIPFVKYSQFFQCNFNYNKINSNSTNCCYHIVNIKRTI